MVYTTKSTAVGPSDMAVRVDITALAPPDTFLCNMGPLGLETLPSLHGSKGKVYSNWMTPLT